MLAALRGCTTKQTFQNLGLFCQKRKNKLLKEKNKLVHLSQYKVSTKLEGLQPCLELNANTNILTFSMYNVYDVHILV